MNRKTLVCVVLLIVTIAAQGCFSQPDSSQTNSSQPKSIK